MALPVAHAPFADSDESLVARLVEGDRSAFDRLYERYLPRVYALAARHHSSRAEIEGVVEETLGRLISSLDDFRGQEHVSFAAWVLAAARSVLSRRANGSG